MGLPVWTQWLHYISGYDIVLTELITRWEEIYMDDEYWNEGPEWTEEDELFWMND